MLSQCDCLWLSHAEATRLGEQIRQDLVCRTAADIDQPILVADVPVSAAEGWRLMKEIQQLHSGECREKQGDRLIEGF